MWRAAVDTRHFHFEGFGATKDEAETWLRRALRIHARQYALADWDAFVRETAADAQVEYLAAGGYRDRERIAHR